MSERILQVDALARTVPRADLEAAVLDDAPLALAAQQNIAHFDSVNGGLGGA